ncbi:MAG TPA: hypothetical protein VFV86_12325 [Nitrososphaeraceae archaeon]|nr:hypothetical protein [Nitrososphaeraceae archaeon]
MVDSTKNIAIMDGLENMKIYYSTFINYLSDSIKNSDDKVIKNIGDSLLFYFPKTSNNNDINSFKKAIECCFKILDSRHSVNEELAKQHLPPFNYRISIDYGVLDLA